MVSARLSCCLSCRSRLWARHTAPRRRAIHVPGGQTRLLASSQAMLSRSRPRMRTSRLHVLVALFSVCTAQAADENVWMCIYGGVGYHFTATPEVIAKLPDWAMDVDEPPLAPRKAERIARKKLAELFPDGRRWRIESVTLQP